MPSTTVTTIAPHPDVVWAELDGGMRILLHVGTGRYYSLNQTGSRIWHLLEQGLDACQISHEIQAEFDVTAERADECVANLIDELVTERLLDR